MVGTRGAETRHEERVHAVGDSPALGPQDGDSLPTEASRESTDQEGTDREVLKHLDERIHEHRHDQDREPEVVQRDSLGVIGEALLGLGHDSLRVLRCPIPNDASRHSPPPHYLVLRRPGMSQHPHNTHNTHGTHGQEQDGVDLISEFETLRAQRHNWNTHWQEIAQRMWPMHFNRFNSFADLNISTIHIL